MASTVHREHLTNLCREGVRRKVGEGDSGGLVLGMVPFYQVGLLLWALQKTKFKLLLSKTTTTTKRTEEEYTREFGGK